MISTRTRIAGFAFDNCIMNAAGVYDYTAAELDAMQQSAAATFVTKSATVVPRELQPRTALLRHAAGQHQFHGSAQFRPAVLPRIRFAGAAASAR